jgi:hypothetical protein
MTTFDWTTAIDECCAHLASLGNSPAAHDPALQAIAVVCLIADTPIRHELTPGSTIPVLMIPRYSGRHDLVDDLLAELTLAAAEPARGNSHKVFSPTNWLAEHGFDDLIIRSVRHTADDSGRAALLAHIARRAQDLMKEQDRLRELHMRRLLGRDLPGLDAPAGWSVFEPNVLAWLLAHEFDGDRTRAMRVQRRFQALRLYAGISGTLRGPAVTQAIDDGAELVPVLRKRLSLTCTQLRALREATPPEAIASYRRHSLETVVLHLQAHAIPVHQWPGGGLAGQHAAWSSSPWLAVDDLARDLTPIPADYYGADPTTVRDAVHAFSDDLLAPLLNELKPPADTSNVSPSAILNALTPKLLPAIQQYLACIRRALIGPRGPKSFQEAAHLWHRRAAAVAALRNENQADRPGWPPLCPVWTSPCSHYQIVPLTTATALVEEGNAHDDCVGTYYDACRSGGTQILSLRENGKPSVTAEILLDRRIASIRVGQFRGFHNEVPDDPALRQAMRDFLRDLRGGVHPLNRKQLRAYREWAEEHCSYYGSQHLTLAHARQAFPLYLPLLPRGTPGDFDQWCDQTGLREGLGAVLPLLPQYTRQEFGF